jgi:hypothetical protein
LSHTKIFPGLTKLTVTPYDVPTNVMFSTSLEIPLPTGKHTLNIFSIPPNAEFRSPRKILPYLPDLTPIRARDFSGSRSWYLFYVYCFLHMLSICSVVDLYFSRSRINTLFNRLVCKKDRSYHVFLLVGPR